MSRNMLKELRKRKGLTQAKMANELQISLSHYKNMESGSRNTTLSNARKLSLFFGRDIEDIFFN